MQVEKFPFLQLPEELQLYVLSFCYLEDLSECIPTVCKSLHVLSYDNTLWTELSKRYIHPIRLDPTKVKISLIREIRLTLSAVKRELPFKLPDSKNVFKIYDCFAAQVVENSKRIQTEMASNKVRTFVLQKNFVVLDLLMRCISFKSYLLLAEAFRVSDYPTLRILYDADQKFYNDDALAAYKELPTLQKARDDFIEARPDWHLPSTAENNYTSGLQKVRFYQTLKHTLEFSPIPPPPAKKQRKNNPAIPLQIIKNS